MNNEEQKATNLFDRLNSPKGRAIRNWICIALCLFSVTTVFLLAFSPICISVDEEVTFNAWGAFEAANSDDPILQDFFLLEFVSLLLIAITLLVTIVFTFKAGIRFSRHEAVAKNTKTTLIVASVFTALYTAFTFIFSPLNAMMGGGSLSKVSFLPLILIAIVDVIFALTIETVNVYNLSKSFEASSAAKKHAEERKKYKRSIFIQQLILLVFSAVIFVISTLALMSNIILVTFESSIVQIPDYVISGKNLLFGTAILSTQGERLVSYCIFLLFFLTATLLLLSIVSFISRSSQFGKIASASVLLSSISCFLVGLFGQYYKVVQQLNEEMTLKLLGDYPTITEDLLKYEIRSETLVYTLILIGVLIILFVCHPLTRAKAAEQKLMTLGGTYHLASAEIQVDEASMSEISGSSYGSGSGSSSGSVLGSIASSGAAVAYTNEDGPLAVSVEQGELKIFDPCPAFTEIDNQIDVYLADLEAKRKQLFISPTLPSLVTYIVQYARDSKHHLSYTDEKVATFFAGLGATKLSILQGMSGTGKTSLPKILSEALMSTCDIVEVESAWRDKNELLGYYNEFSKIYTPKKFTQALYKACLNSDTLTFIVLDEMNLSRIEYYFSDFLSLMENDPDEREIKLLNLSLAKKENDVRKPYEALVGGHTLKIPPNVWFIGTANRDESTYDISDKVYDRAHTMNFDRRAKKPVFYGDPIPQRYLPASELTRLFEEAKAAIKINIDEYPVVKKTEELLEPYNISFGNRIAMQIESFVSIYAACFTASEQVIHDAFDIILLSKVVKKLELKSVVDKEDLAGEFEKIGLKRCAEFIINLKED